jgi:hypothetical protein
LCLVYDCVHRYLLWWVTLKYWFMSKLSYLTKLWPTYGFMYMYKCKHFINIVSTVSTKGYIYCIVIIPLGYFSVVYIVLTDQLWLDIVLLSIQYWWYFRMPSNINLWLTMNSPTWIESLSVHNCGSVFHTA